MHFVLNSVANNDDYVINTDTKMIIMGLTGYVGIGTNAPTNKLDITGEFVRAVMFILFRVPLIFI